MSCAICGPSFIGVCVHGGRDIQTPWKTIYAAGNKTSTMYFESKEDAQEYADSCGVMAGVKVWSAPMLKHT